MDRVGFEPTTSALFKGSSTPYLEVEQLWKGSVLFKSHPVQYANDHQHPPNL
jgi:hypothetical protein